MSQVTVHLRYARIAPRKARAVVDLIRGKSTSFAQAQLTALNKKAAHLIQKLLLAGIAAAKEKKMATEAMHVQMAVVQEGPRLKRARSHFRGTIRPIDKQMSHITLVLSDDASAVEREERAMPDRASFARRASGKGKRPVPSQERIYGQ